jgi:hypothetical protein
MQRSRGASRFVLYIFELTRRNRTHRSFAAKLLVWLARPLFGSGMFIQVTPVELSRVQWRSVGHAFLADDKISGHLYRVLFQLHNRELHYFFVFPKRSQIRQRHQKRPLAGAALRSAG